MMKAEIKNTFIGLILSFVLFCGCAKDKTVEEANQKKLDDKMAVLEKVKGSYRGGIVRQDDGTSIGNIQIDIYPQVFTVNSGDNSSATTHAGLQGTITISNAFKSLGVMQLATYFSPDNTTNGIFSGNISILIPASANSSAQTVQMSISGSIRGDSFIGQISMQNRAGVTGVFATVKNGALPVATSSSSTINNVQKFVGEFNSKEKINVTMTIQRGNKVEENFINNFAFQKSVTISFNLSDEHGTFDGETFEGAQLDELNGEIHAVTKYEKSVSAIINLDCFLEKVAAIPSWDCTYMSTYNGVPFHFTAVQVKR